MCIVLTMGSVTQAKSPDALDAEFLEYIAACEHADDNWTVVADEALRKKAAKNEKKPTRPPVREVKPEARP
jgi:hypothetical protein